MSDIILHHYPQSPVAEKVRVILGIKSLDWKSVEIPRLPPKPDLVPLTGGYRRTPVMQIGATVFCDSQCIIRELERRYPKPTIFPSGDQGLAWGVSRWTDGPLFTHAIALVLGSAQNLPAEFASDRGRLYFGEEFELSKIQTEVNHSLGQIRGQLQWIEQNLVDGRNYICGEKPGLIDALGYYLVWFIRGRWDRGPEFLSQFPQLVAWENRVNIIGHGQPVSIEPATALEIATSATPDIDMKSDPGEFDYLAPGMEVSIVPQGDGGDPRVSGKIVSLDSETLVIVRQDARIGEIAVHFPRVGYRVEVG